MSHLWEYDHPYYCTEGNFYARPSEGLHTAYGSWTEFHAEWGDLDPDMNLVFRWDWVRPDPDDYDDDEEMPPESLKVFWVLQRKAILRSTECVVTEADEPAVRAWLTEKTSTIRDIWAPLLPRPAEVLRDAADRIERRAAQLGGVWLKADQVCGALRTMADAAEAGDQP